ncbi:MAG: 50S ribosomal protein L25/general stress protein Ctc [Bacteroidota bacterium]
MKSLTIKGTKRTEISKQAVKQLRGAGKVPCVLYGGKENVHFATPIFDFKPLVYTDAVHTVQLSIDGSDYTAMMKEIQFHPITDRIIHIDFLEINPEKEVVIDIPVKVKGTSEGVKEGGRLIQKIRKLKISALMNNLPDNVEIDITSLKIGDSVKVANLKKEGVTFLDASNNIVVGVRVTRAVVEEVVAAPATGAVAGAVPAEGAPAAGAAAPAAGAAPAAAKAPEKGKK